jgi:nucleotide-binding universal stress UspA family protein
MIMVEELPNFPTTVDEVIEETRSENEIFHRVIEQAAAKAKVAHVKIEPHVVAGHAVPSIVSFIERNGCDLLIIGYMGHSAIYNRLIGGTTDRLVELAPCNVLVVRK